MKKVFFTTPFFLLIYRKTTSTQYVSYENINKGGFASNENNQNEGIVDFYEKFANGEEKCINDELPFEIPSSWEWVRLNNIVYFVGNRHNQILSKEVLKEGKYPAVSQGINLIEGYCNDDSKVIKDLPLVMFGDHTRNVKYIDFEFVISADGTKFMKTILCDPKYFYHCIKIIAVKLKNRGYERHFILLKEKFFPLHPLEEQNRIVDKIEELFKIIEPLTEK